MLRVFVLCMLISIFLMMFFCMSICVSFMFFMILLMCFFGGWAFIGVGNISLKVYDGWFLPIFFSFIFFDVVFLCFGGTL